MKRLARIFGKSECANILAYRMFGDVNVLWMVTPSSHSPNNGVVGSVW